MANGVFYPQDRTAWRRWLEKNHQTEQAVWLVYYTKKSNIASISWREAVDEALCFGWIDSTRKTIDDSSFMQLFSKRKPKSMWSRINKEKVQQLIDGGRMTQAGYACIAAAKQNGSWTILDEIEDLAIPKDLEDAFKHQKGSRDFFLGLSKSTRKMILSWIILAKRQETRRKRIAEIAECAGQQLKPRHLR